MKSTFCSMQSMPLLLQFSVWPLKNCFLHPWSYGHNSEEVGHDHMLPFRNLFNTACVVDSAVLCWVWWAKVYHMKTCLWQLSKLTLALLSCKNLWAIIGCGVIRPHDFFIEDCTNIWQVSVFQNNTRNFQIKTLMMDIRWKLNFLWCRRHWYAYRWGIPLKK